MHSRFVLEHYTVKLRSAFESISFISVETRKTHSDHICGGMDGCGYGAYGEAGREVAVDIVVEVWGLRKSGIEVVVAVRE